MENLCGIPAWKIGLITGVSGSGKSTLINETLYPAVAKELNGSRKYPLAYQSIKGELNT
ncbi:MAG: hypothetical protein CM1200mP10_05260 [Candidatus Neomarinimicrobiota bacterium]|nr:MAG: hypothetical protein CM1200mP10_05260 [Candidatus Neomarinimicrobiota bacterium]